MSLPLSLRLNAAFSLATGLLLTAAPGAVGNWLDVSITGWLGVLGVVLIGHAGLLVWVSRQPSVATWAKLNVAAIAPYPLIMAGLIATGLVSTTLGRTLLLLDGAIVAAIAFAQWNGLRRSSEDAHPVPA